MKSAGLWSVIVGAVALCGCQFQTFKEVIQGKGYVPRNSHGVPIQSEPEARPVDPAEENPKSTDDF